SQAGDFWAVPDLSTLYRVPHTHSSAQTFCDLVAAGGRPWATCGRAAVRRVNELVEQELGSVSLGFEQEGYVLRKNGGRYEPVVVGRQMQPEILDRLDGFITDLTAALQVMDVPVEKVTAEGGGGMFEVNFPQGPPLEAAERWFRCKQVFRIVARERGMVGTFMPKPFSDRVRAQRPGRRAPGPAHRGPLTGRYVQPLPAGGRPPGGGARRRPSPARSRSRHRVRRCAPWRRGAAGRGAAAPAPEQPRRGAGWAGGRPRAARADGAGADRR